MEITRGAGGAVTADSVSASGCGTLQPILDTAATFDQGTGVLRIPIVLRNEGLRALRAPARLYGWEDSLRAISPAGLLNDSLTNAQLSYTNPDSVNNSGPAAVLWRFDTLLSSGVNQQLEPDSRSRRRWVEVILPDTVQVARLRLRTQAERVRLPVPSVAPDTLPIGLYDDSNFVNDPSVSHSRFLRDVAVILFTAEASLEARQAAVDRLYGEVIGGMRLPDGDGFYFVRTGLSDQSTLLAEIDTLNRQTHVLSASLETSLESPAGYRKPNDASGFSSSDWQTRPPDATGYNWALESVAAPLAWGCSIGSSTVAVAVVDLGIVDTVSDLRHNAVVNYRTNINPVSEHGTGVAAIVAARGNDSVGMTGTMWRASLRLYGVEQLNSGGQLVLDTLGNPLYSTHAVARRVAQAAHDGAKVINLSLYYSGWPFLPGSAADSQEV